MQMQNWARENTPEDALFMPDPSTYGGWRDVSRRASFGTATEWLHNAWLYDSDPALFKEGLRRFGLLGLEPESFYGIGDSIDARRALSRAVSESYYGASPEWFAALARNEGINYFIFDRSKLPKPPAGMSLAFENEKFSIYAPPPGETASESSDAGGAPKLAPIGK